MHSLGTIKKMNIKEVKYEKDEAAPPRGPTAAAWLLKTNIDLKNQHVVEPCHHVWMNRLPFALELHFNEDHKVYCCLQCITNAAEGLAKK